MNHPLFPVIHYGFRYTSATILTHYKRLNGIRLYKWSKNRQFISFHPLFVQSTILLTKSNRYCRLKKQIKHDKNITEIQQQQQKFNNDDVNKIIILRRIYYWLKSVVGGRGKKRKSFKLSLLEIPKRGRGEKSTYSVKKGARFIENLFVVFLIHFILFFIPKLKIGTNFLKKKERRRK